MPPHARWEKLLVENTEMDVFVDEPTTPGPHPAIVVAHHRAGNDVATTKFVQDLAGCGYVAASPHLHHRRPKGEDTRDSIANLDDNQIVADLNATAEMLQMMNNVDPNRMAIAGHCMGGRVSFLGVSEIGRSNVTLPITVAICSRLWAPVMQVPSKSWQNCVAQYSVFSALMTRTHRPMT